MNNIDHILKLFYEEKINYSPKNYWYASVSPYPRRLMSFNKKNINLNLKEFKVMIYIHTPYCTRKCTFCPFFKDVSENVSNKYINSLKKEISIFKKNNPLPKKINIYFGGGSPNLLTIKQISNIISLFKNYDINEMSIELHPEVYSKKDYIYNLRKLGFNKISIGLQINNLDLLNDSNRGKGINYIQDTINLIKVNKIKLNVDLMYGGLYKETIKNSINNFNYIFKIIKPDFVTIYQVGLNPNTLEYNRYIKNKKRYLNPYEILKLKEKRQIISKKEGYKYLYSDYFSKIVTNNKYLNYKWNEKSAVIGFGAGAYSYIIDNGNNIGFCWYNYFDISKYLTNSDKVERFTKLDSNILKSWGIISKLKKGCLSGNDIILKKLYDKGFLKKKNDLYCFTKKGLLIEDMIYSVIFPIELWRKLYNKDKLKQDIYDWYYQPIEIIKFYNYLNK
jgi:oxygen-independent coproporphyrinogen III oxidase